MSSADHALLAAARTAAAHAHAPYSGFGVGAAVLLSNGEIVAGCNFENASYGLTLCAETVALASVNAQGQLRNVQAIAVIGGLIKDGLITGSEPVRPCGRCRQVIHEAAQLSLCDIPVTCGAAEGNAVEVHRISALLPHAFGPGDIGVK